jgi:hypothetical protein
MKTNLNEIKNQIANLVYVDKNGNVNGQQLTDCTLVEMKEYVITVLGYIPQWVALEVIGQKSISL